MVLTILKANVPQDRQVQMRDVFEKNAKNFPEGLLETYLIHDLRDPESMEIHTFWRSMEDLQKMRSSEEKPKGVQMFEAVGATPQLTVASVLVHKKPSS